MRKTSTLTLTALALGLLILITTLRAGNSRDPYIGTIIAAAALLLRTVAVLSNRLRDHLNRKHGNR
jgi:hypothetical protein